MNKLHYSIELEECHIILQKSHKSLEIILYLKNLLQYLNGNANGSSSATCPGPFHHLELLFVIICSVQFLNHGKIFWATIPIVYLTDFFQCETFKKM